MRKKQPRVSAAMRSKKILTAARAYILENGWPLVVMHGIDKHGKCTCKRRDCSSQGKHPIKEFFPHGTKSATREIPNIRAALKKFPRANIAAVLNDLTVVDVDGMFGETQIEGLDLPETATSLTGRGYHHFFSGFLPTGSVKSKDLDLLSGKSRCVMLPPSLHVSGERYTWDRSCNKIINLPDALIDFSQGLKKPIETTKTHRPQIIPRGERNDALFRIACSLRLRVTNEDTILEMLDVMNQHVCEEPLSDAELEQLMKSSGRYDQDTDPLFGPPTERDPLPVEWLWYPYVPLHGLTIIAGNPGTGKSLLTALLMATLTSGLKWPLSDEVPSGKRVLLLAAEDDWARTTLPRTLKAGGNVDNIRLMLKFRALTEDIMLQLSEEMANDPPDLVIIDTVSAYMGAARDMHRQNHVGGFLADLTQLANKAGCAIVVIAHLNKQSTEDPLFRIVGSIGFVATVRSALFLGFNPEDRSQLALAQGKINDGDKGKTIIFENTGGGRKDVPVLTPVGFSDADENDVCRSEPGTPGRPNVKQEQATAFILGFLTDGLVPWSEVITAAKTLDISAGTLALVRNELRKSGKIKQVGKGPKAKWRLASSQPKADADENQ